MDVAIAILLLLFILTLCGALASFVKVPLPILQIAIGLILAWPANGLHLALDPDLFLLVFIPPLLFSDAFNAPKREFQALKVPILGLAFGLVFFTVFILGYALHWLIPTLPLSVAFALGAVLSPTDAVAVSSIVDRQRVPGRLMHILEGEALLNDASGLVIFRFAVAATLTGQFSLPETARFFFLAVVGGILAGFVSVLCSVQLLRLLRKRDGTPSEAQVLLTLLLPFAAYLLAEHFDASGILAAVTAGLTVGRAGFFRHLSVGARLKTGVVWDTVPFAFNGAIFLLLGIQLPTILRSVPSELSTRLPVIEPFLTVLGLTFVLIAVRFAWISGGIGIRRWVGHLRHRPEPKESLRVKIATSVAGVRGAVTLAGILSLPLALPDGSPFPSRDVAIFLAAGVILCSLGLASLFLPAITRGLKMAEDDPIEEEERFARIIAAQAAIDQVEALAADAEAAGRLVARDVAGRLIENYRRRAASSDLSEDIHKEARDASDVEKELLAAALNAERNAVRKLLLENRINDETLHKLLAETVLAEALIARNWRA
ncbi:Na+/H+ antiporter [Labrys okinawensis]|uniref:Na+/H+ antiporter n=1 Tax=Labrys okinawensis TaxID=346911 RepID=UPI0039BD18BF